MQLTDLTPFTLNALLLLATTTAGIVVIVRRPRPIWLVVLLALTAGGGFAILMNDRGLSWWGLLGDEAFIGAAITKAWHGVYWSDFYYTSLPPFYPPLYYWITGFVGRLINLPPIGAMNAGVAASLFLLPLTIYFGIRLLPIKLAHGRSDSEVEGRLVAKSHPSTSSGTNTEFKKWFGFLAAGTVLIVSEWVGFLSKPFEFLTAAIAILWIVHVIVHASNKIPSLQKEGRDKRNKKNQLLITNHQLLKPQKILLTTIILGTVGALLVWTYYFWMIFAVIAIALAGIRFASGIRKQWYGRIVGILGISALLSAPFWINLIRGALAGGEAWQANWFTIEELTLFPTLLHGLPAIIALIGIGSLIAFRKKTIPFILGMAFLAPVLWFVMNLFTILFAQTAVLPTKAMHFIGAYTLAFAAAWVVSTSLSKERFKRFCKGILITTWILFTLSVPSGLFAYKFGNEHILSLSQSKETKEVVDYLLTIDNLTNQTALVSEQPRIVGQAPVNVFLSFNMHFTHPQARWSERYLIVHELSTAQSPEEFNEIARNNPFDPIDLLILTKRQQSNKVTKQQYELYLWRDNFPNGGKDQTISFPASLVSKKQWKKLFENKQFVVWEYLAPENSNQPNQ